MSRIAEKSRKAFKAAGLFEPKSRAAKLRHSLPGIEQALANGASIESCRDALKSVGLVFASVNAFNVALYRARRSRLSALDTETRANGGTQKPLAAKPGIPQEVFHRAAAAGVGGADVLDICGVPFIRPKKAEDKRNREPEMSDFL